MKPRICRCHPLNRHLGRARFAAKFTSVLSNAKHVIFRLVEFHFPHLLMHHTPIKTIRECVCVSQRECVQVRERESVCK